MTIIFCNIGWMEKYNGIDGDTIKRGGAYNKIAIGHEVCNFMNVNNDVYGYVQPTGQIKIEKLGANKHDDKIDNITVVWLAGPDSGGTVVIGWYKNATVYRHPKELKFLTKEQKKNSLATYRIKAKSSDATLLSIENRTLMIPRRIKGGIGQSNIWYADKPESRSYLRKVHDIINGVDYTIPTPDIDQDSFGTEGNPRFRMHISRERNARIIKEKKKNILKINGCLKCEVCDFDFKEYYGDLGNEFCEVHHLIPLHKGDGIIETKLSDLAIICSNCHRMIHRTTPMISIQGLKHILNNK